MHKKRSPAQQLHALAVIRQDTAEQGIEARAVVVMRDMAELMHHHEVNGLVGVLHEPPGKAKAVPAVTAPEARFRAGDLHAGRHKAGHAAPMRHALRQLGPRARKERFALGLCRLGMRGKVFRLTGAGAGEPRLMRGDKRVDLLHAEPQRRVDDHRAVALQLHRERSPP